jgi:hypothetical protein
MLCRVGSLEDGNRPDGTTYRMQNFVGPIPAMHSPIIGARTCVAPDRSAIFVSPPYLAAILDCSHFAIASGIPNIRGELTANKTFERTLEASAAQD